jgi:hypothetical protein
VRTWMVLASYDPDAADARQEQLDDDPNSLERVICFQSGDGDMPPDGDLNAALAEASGDGHWEFLLVPLDDAKKVSVDVSRRAEIASTGNYVPGLVRS